MLCVERVCRPLSGRRVAGLALVAALVSGGCSADITRFDSPFFGLTESGSSGPPPRRGAEAPIVNEPPLAQSGGTYAPTAGNRSSGITVAALPNVERAPLPAPAAVAVAPLPPAPRSQGAPKAPPVAAAPRPTPKGEPIEVQQGDTIYGISKRYNVSISELMSINAITNPNLTPGQKLWLPGGAKRVASAPVAKAEPRQPAPKPVETAAIAQPAAPASWAGTYTVKSGDNLYGIARQRGVNPAELQRVNGIADVRKIQPGTVLKVPGEAAGGGQSAATTTRAAPQPAPVEPAPQFSSGPRPTVLNGSRVAIVAPKDPMLDMETVAGDAGQGNAAKPAPAQPKGATAAKLRWPVRGKIIAGFGAHADGTNNDGVNVAVPLGTEVLAAEAGVVAYAGSEVKGYGNLVLVRHDNGWVTAYAHNDQLLVQRGDRVRRGQALARAGKTGSVDQPQLHFELRQGPKPVDPLPHMERM